MKKILLSLLFLMLVKTAWSATILSGFYNRFNEVVELEVGYCFNDEELPRIDFLEGVCQATFPASCDVIVDVIDESPFPLPGDICGSEILSYDVIDLPRPVVLNFLTSDGSVGSILVD
ncbi:MAG: hypothetical protein KC505_11405 [Myxococcales bacterium]|nr:hypothetical protein [Myxococcales bacterium]USN49775.1 MAG: hypothetical protein H6731_05700 [Myxococcales bacterium]